MVDPKGPVSLFKKAKNILRYPCLLDGEAYERSSQSEYRQTYRHGSTEQCRR